MFVAKHTDQELLAFLIDGHPADAPDSTMKVAMPPRGNNPTMTDERLLDVIAFLRQLRAAAKHSSPTAAAP